MDEQIEPATNWPIDADRRNDPYSEPYIQVHEKGFTPLPGGINVGDMNFVATGLHECQDGERADFYDSQARSIHYPRRDAGENKTPKACFHEGYARMIWDFIQGNIFQGQNIDGTADKTLYRRDVDMSGESKRLDSWHVLDMQGEYAIPKTQWNPMWVKQMLFETSQLKMRVHRGVKFTNMVFCRLGTEYETDPVVCIPKGNPGYDWPYLVNLQCDYDDKIADEADELLRLMTADDNGHSAQNLSRIFATPMLEPYKHLTYIMYGDGGNGKGLIVKSMKQTFKEKIASVDAQKLLGGQRGGGGFSTDQEVLKLLGAMWAFDEEANDITLEQMTNLKRISTGDPLVARRIQENSIEVQPYAAFTICSNNPVVTTMTAASARRFAFIRMSESSDWRRRELDPVKPMDKETTMRRVRAFITKHGATGWMMSSCRLWITDEARRIAQERQREADRAAGKSKLTPHWEDHWTDVVIGSGSDLTRAQEWYITQILHHGLAVSRDCPYKENDIEHKNTIAMLGLESTTKRVDGVNRRVLVKSKRGAQRFDNYARQIIDDEKTADVPPEIPYDESAEPESWKAAVKRAAEGNMVGGEPSSQPVASAPREQSAPTAEQAQAKPQAQTSVPAEPVKQSKGKINRPKNPRKQDTRQQSDSKTVQAASDKPLRATKPAGRPTTPPPTVRDPGLSENDEAMIGYDPDKLPTPPAGWDDIPFPNDDKEPYNPEFEPPAPM